MAIVLDHTIVPARDKEASARFFAEMFGLEYKGTSGHFAPVYVNDSLTFDFDNRDSFEQSPLRLPHQRRGVRRDPRAGEGGRAEVGQRASVA